MSQEVRNLKDFLEEYNLSLRIMYDGNVRKWKASLDNMAVCNINKESLHQINVEETTLLEAIKVLLARISNAYLCEVVDKKLSGAVIKVPKYLRWF